MLLTLAAGVGMPLETGSGPETRAGSWSRLDVLVSSDWFKFKLSAFSVEVIRVNTGV